jgi:hypothetical protein
MRCRYTRRGFVRGAIAAAGAAAWGTCLEEQALLAQTSTQSSAASAATAATGPATQPARRGERIAPGSRNTIPTGAIGELKLSRLILGGNLIAGFAHSRELVYVSQLLKHYFTDEKILETLELAEAHGVNAVNTNPGATKVIQRYRKQRGGTIRWIVQGYPTPQDKLTGVKRSVDDGADAIYIQGNIADALVEKGNVDLIDQVVRYVQSQGIPAGVGGHSLDVPKACEKAGVKADFYVKTLHTADYFSARRPDQPAAVIHNPADNFWCDDPAATIEYMKAIDKPWIAYKVMAAGAIPPRQAFQHAFANGADFVLAGMFDFQIAQDARLAKDILAKLQHPRPWRG